MPAISRRTALRAAAAAFFVPAAKISACPALAASPAEIAAPLERLEAALIAAMKAGTATPFAQRFTMVGAAVDQAFDLSAVLKNVVGLRWDSLPEAQRAQLQTLFRTYTIATWVSNFDAWSGQRFERLPELRPAGNGELIVQTRIVTASGSATRLDFVMRQTASGWRATDVLADGSISRVAVLRSDFRRLLTNGDGSPLIATLRGKVATLSGGTLA